MKKVIFHLLIIPFLVSLSTKLYAGTVNDSLFEVLENQISNGNDSILIILNEKLQLAKVNADSLTSAKVSYIIGKYYLLRTFDYPLAYNYFFRSLNNFKICFDTTRAGRSEMQIGLIYFLQRNFDESQFYFESAYNKMLLSGDSARTGRLAYLLGLTYSEKKENNKALHYLRIAKNYIGNNNSDQAKTEYSYGMGKYYLNLDNGDSALYYLLPLLENSQDQNDTASIQRYSAEVAQAWKLKGNIEKTEYFAKKVITAKRNINTEIALMNSYHLLYEIAMKKNDYKNSVNYLNKYITLKDSILNEKNIFNLASLNTKLTLEKVRKENDLRDAKQQAIIEKQKVLKIILILSGVFLLLIVIILQKKNKQLAESYEKLKSIQEQLINQEKLASMGKLSAGLAHEMLNPLNFVIGFSKGISDMLDEMEMVPSGKEKYLMISEIKNNLSKISEYANRMEISVKQVINHVRIVPGLHKLTNIHELCDVCLNMFLHSVDENQIDFKDQIRKNYLPNIPLILINPQEIGRVLLNIFSNSFQAIEEKLQNEKFVPEIEITTTLNNNILSITVTDNGNGIKKELMENIFVHFFTTRAPGKGVGLGLSVANDIIKSYGGKIKAQSKPGVFTSIEVQLPV